MSDGTLESRRAAATGMERLRWKIVWRLNRLPLCWADLVTWALGWHGFRDVRRTGNATCQRDLAANGSCYCGKLRASSGTENPK